MKRKIISILLCTAFILGGCSNTQSTVAETENNNTSVESVDDTKEIEKYLDTEMGQRKDSPSVLSIEHQEEDSYASKDKDTSDVSKDKDASDNKSTENNNESNEEDLDQEQSEDQYENAADDFVDNFDTIEFNRLKKFSATTLAGQKFDQKSLKQYDVTVFVFWSPSCQPCLAELPFLSYYEKELPKNVQMVIYAKNHETGALPLEEIFKTSTYGGIVAYDGKNDLATLSDTVMATPAFLFVDSKGNVIERLIAYDPWDFENIFNDKLKNCGIGRK